MKRKIVFIAGIINAALGAVLVAFAHGKIQWQYLFLVAGFAASAYAMKWPGDTDKKE